MNANMQDLEIDSNPSWNAFLRFAAQVNPVKQNSQTSPDTSYNNYVCVFAEAARVNTCTQDLKTSPNTS